MQHKLQQRESHQVAFDVLPSSPAGPGVDQDSATKAYGLIAFWHARWGACERLNDLPSDLGRLRLWANDIALFDLMDHGADFRARMVGKNLVPIFGRDWFGARLSGLPSPYRQALRQVLLRASMLREPVAEHCDWLVESRQWSCTTCAMPVAGELFQPTRFLLGIFYPEPASDPTEMTC
jgi:hypothetical protein